MSSFIRDHLDFLDSARDWASLLRAEGRRLTDRARAEFFLNMPSPFSAGNLGAAPLETSTSGNLGGSSAEQWIRRGVSTSASRGECPTPSSGDGAHWADALCERANCGDDILPFDTVDASGFPLAGGTNGTYTQVMTGARTLLPYYFFFLGLDANAGLAEIPARMINVKVGSTDQLLAPNFSSLVCSSLRQRIPVRWGLFSSDASGQAVFTFANDLAAPATLRVLGMVQGEPNVAPA